MTNNSLPTRRKPIPIKEKPLSHAERVKHGGCYTVTGDEARSIANDMKVRGQSRADATHHLVELSEHPDYTNICAHGSDHLKIIKVYADKSVIELNIDHQAGQATQTVYSPNGDIEVLETKWSFEEGGYHAPFQRTSLQSNNESECEHVWRRCEVLIHRATKAALAQENGLSL